MTDTTLTPQALDELESYMESVLHISQLPGQHGLGSVRTERLQDTLALIAEIRRLQKALDDEVGDPHD